MLRLASGLGQSAMFKAEEMEGLVYILYIFRATEAPFQPNL